MTYGKFKDLNKRTKSDRVLMDKGFVIASNPKYDGCQRGLAWMLYNFFDRKYLGCRFSWYAIIKQIQQSN